MRTLVIFTSGSTEAKKKIITPDLRLLCTCRFSDILLQLSGGGGGGGYSTNFYTGRLRLEVQPLTLLNEKGTPLKYLPLTNDIPFTYFV